MEVRTQEEYDLLPVFREMGANFWIGASDNETERDWRWVSNGDQVNISDPVWYQNRPQTKTNQNCLSVYLAQFCYLPCLREIKFACEHN